MQNGIAFEEAQKFSGYLEKKSKGLITTWQKRYFRILEGKIIVYMEKPEDIEIKGQFILDQITIPQSVESNVFKFNLESRDFIFRAKDEEEKNKWINIIILLKNKITETREKEFERRFSGSNISNIQNRKETSRKTMQKKNKLTSAGKVTAEIIRRNGFVTNKEQKLSNNLLKSKGIDKLINLKDPKINSRIYYGFIYKKHKIHDYFQKRWFFLFSSRPLFDNYYSEDDTDLEQKKQKDWLKFDTLFYFKYEDNEINSETLGSLELVKSHKVELLDKDDKFYLYLDVEDRRFDFYCDSKAERDIWFEVLKNSRRTAKEYQASVTKHPRNIQLLYSFFLLGERELFKKIDKEKLRIIGDYKEINEFNIFEFNQNNLENLIESTIDGCNSNNPPKKDLLKSYTEYMNKEYLDIIKYFWENRYKEIENNDILKMSMMLFIFGEKLNLLNVNDPNFFKNGKELSKIYLKKTYQNVLSVIENILKKEREIKALKHEMGYYYTRGPNDLFETLSRTFDLLKENKNKCLYELTLNLFYSSINQYLLGTETVLTNLDIILEKEYLLAVANNSLNMIQLLNSLLDDTKDMKVLNEQEINESFNLKKIMTKVNKVSQKAITSFVFCFLNDLGSCFQNYSYTSLDMTKILISTNEIFGPFRQYMNSLVLKKSWNEILKLTLYHYIHLLITSNMNKSSVDQIKEKLKIDVGILTETYQGLVGKNLTEATIKILNDIHDFLDVSPYMISSSCLTLKEYIGPTFNISKAKALIKLRTDFNEDDINDAIDQCKEVLEKYQENNKQDADSLSYFQIIEMELKRKAKEEKKLERERTKQEDKEKKNKEKEKKEGEEEEEEEDEEEKIDNEEGEKDIDIVNFNLDDFLDEDEEEKEKEEKEVGIIKHEEEDKEAEQEEVSDITYEGYMQKKSHSTWQTRYFQIKNGYLYWFKDKTSSIVQNKISIKNTLRVDSHKDKKFMMIVANNGDNKDGEDGENRAESGGKVYKFACESDEEKNGWVSAITNEMKRLKKGEEKGNNNNRLEILERKKIIIDYFNLPEINRDIYYMKKKVLEEMNNENYFKPSLRKIEALRRKEKREEKERKIREKEEKERKKREEKEEKERKKREENEEKERRKKIEKEEKMRRKIEENKKIEEDLKSGKKVGVTDRLKFWFRNNVEGIKTDNNEEKIKNNVENKDKEIAVNEINLEDFGLGDDNEDENNKDNNINDNNNIDNIDNNLDNNKNNKDNENDKEINNKSNNNNNEIIKENNKDNNEKINEIKNENNKEADNKINNDKKDNYKKDLNEKSGEIKKQEKEINQDNIVNNNNKENKINENNNVKKNEEIRRTESKSDKVKGWFKNTFNFRGSNIEEEIENKEKEQKENEEKERKEKEKKEKERREKEEKERREKEEKERREKLEKERREKLEKERREKEEKERREKLEKERKEKEEKERREKKEKERREKLEKERREKLEKERREKLEKERHEKERKEKEKKEKEERERKEKLEKEKREKVEKERNKEVIKNDILSEKKDINEEERKEFNSKLLFKIKKEEKIAEKLHRVIHSVQNKKKIEEKLEKIKENIPNIKTKYEIYLEQNNNTENEFNNDMKKENNEELLVNDWWGDIFKK